MANLSAKDVQVLKDALVAQFVRVNYSTRLDHMSHIVEQFQALDAHLENDDIHKWEAK